MAESRLPQLEEGPTFTPQKISSHAEGAEAFAEVLGKLSNDTSQEIVKENNQKSATMYAASLAEARHVENQAEIDALRNPDQSGVIAQHATEAIEQIKSNAFVNRADRAKLNPYLDSNIDKIKLNAAKNEVTQARLMGAYTHYANWPAQVQSYQDAVQQDAANGTHYAEDMHAAYMQQLKGLVASRTITPLEAANSLQDLHGAVDMAAEHLELYGKENVSARDYHTIKSNPLETNPTEHRGAPVDEGTQWMIDHHNADFSVQGIISGLYEHKLPPMNQYDALKPQDRLHVRQIVHGIREGDGYINSEAPIPQLQSVFEDLNRKDQALSWRQQGLRNRLGVYLERLKSRDYLEAISSAPAGGHILLNYHERQAALQNAPISEEQRNNFLLQNKNDMAKSAIAYGFARHFPTDLIQPIDKSDILNMEAGFSVNGDPRQVLNVVNSYDTQMKPWVAQALKDPKQRVIVNTVALGGNIAPSDKIDLIAANQTGRDYSVVNESLTKGMSDHNIGTLLQTKLEDTFKVIGSTHNAQDAQVLKNEVVNAGLNYAKFLATKNNDYVFPDWAKYTDKVAEVISAAYPKLSNSNYVVNGNLVKEYNQYHTDALALYAVTQGEQYLQRGQDRSWIGRAFDVNPLRMEIRQDGHVSAVDSYGTVYWSAPMSPKLVADAILFSNKKKEEAKQLQAELNALQGIPGSVYVPPDNGPITPGNIDLDNRPVVQNANGSQSTVRTITADIDGKTVLLPTIINGKQVSNKEAIDHYKKTGEHMGVFKSQADADKYDEELHKRKGWTGPGNKWESK